MNKFFCLLAIIIFLFYGWFALLSKNDYPLMSYDEAWYASIAHNIVANNSWMAMSFNGKPYYDHPPIGFWIIALGIKAFGESELVVRAPSMVAALASMLLLYQIAKEKANRWLALIPPFMLGSSLWYVYRARSADLDSLLVFFFIATIFTTLRLTQASKKWPWTLLTALSLAGLVMIKTLVGFGILPALGIILLTTPKNRIKTWGHFLAAAVIAVGLCLPWYRFSVEKYPNFLEYHFLTIGAREGTDKSLSWKEFSETLLYFRSGVGKWYYPAIFSLFASTLLLIIKRFRDRYLLFTLAWFLGVGLPFLLSPKTEVWHLIPLYPPIFLLTIPVLEATRKIIAKRFHEIFIVTVTTGVLLIAVMQIRAFMPLLFQSIEFDRKDIALKARPVTKTLAMKAAFLPTFVYYSQKENVSALWLEQKSYDLMKTCLSLSECNQAFVIDYPDYQLLMKDQLAVSIEASNSSYLIVESLQK